MALILYEFVQAPNNFYAKN